jgi:hypothetical protein
MLSSGILCRVALVRTNVSEECITSIIRVTRNGKLGRTLAVTSNWSMFQLLVTANIPTLLILVTLMMEAICYTETSVLTRATECNIPEDRLTSQTITLYLSKGPMNVYHLYFSCSCLNSSDSYSVVHFNMPSWYYRKWWNMESFS